MSHVVRVSLPRRIAALALLLGSSLAGPALAAGGGQPAAVAAPVVAIRDTPRRAPVRPAATAAPHQSDVRSVQTVRSVSWLQTLQALLGKPAGAAAGGRLVVNAGNCMDPNGQCY
jgi:hypothetical protein